MPELQPITDSEDNDDADILKRLDTVIERERNQPEEHDALPQINIEEVNVGLENALNTVELDELDEQLLEGERTFEEKRLGNTVAPAISKDMSFNVKDASSDIAELHDADDARFASPRAKKDKRTKKAQQKKRMTENMSKMQVFTRTVLNDHSEGRIRSTLYIKGSKDTDWVRTATSESPEFSVFRMEVSALDVNTMRILYSTKTDDGDWKDIGYVSEGLRKVLMAEDSVLNKSVRSVSDARHIGTVTIAVEEMVLLPYNVKMAFGIQGNRVPVGFSQYLRVERLVSGMGMVTVYLSPLPRSQNQWEAFRLPLRKICNGNVDLPISITIVQSNNTDIEAPTTVVGIFHTTVAMCEKLERQACPLTIDGVELDSKLLINSCVLQKFASTNKKKGDKDMSKFTNKLEVGKKFALKTVQKEMARNKCPELIRAGSTNVAAAERYQRIQTRQATMRKKIGRGPIGSTVYRVKMYLETQPLNRLFKRLPVATTVVKVARLFGASTAAFFGFYAYIILMNMVMSAVWIGFVIMPKVVQDSSIEFKPIEVVYAVLGLRRTTDTEAINVTWYGDYDNSTTTDMAYYYTWAALTTIALNIFLISAEVRNTYKRVDFKDHMLHLNTDQTKYKFTFELFGGWDYHVGSEQAHDAQSAGMIVNTKKLLRETELSALRHRQASLTWLQRYKRNTKRLLFIIFSIALGVGSIWGIVWTTNNPDKFDDLDLGVMTPYVQTIVLTAINMVVYPIITFCVKREDYNSHQTESTQIIFRSFFIKVSNIFAVYYNLRFEAPASALAKYQYVCIQDLIGNIFLSLYVTECASDFLNCFFWPLVSKYRGKPHHFHVPTNVIAVVYRQIIVWMGVHYCPILPVTAFVLSFLGFLWKSFALLKLSTPDENPWDTSKAQLFFMQILAIAMFAAMAPMIHFLMTNYSDEGAYFNCGPHLAGEEVIGYMWGPSTPSGIREVIAILVSPVTLVITNVLCVLIITWLTQLLSASSTELKTIAAELEDEHFDKLKLLANAGIVEVSEDKKASLDNVY